MKILKCFLLGLLVPTLLACGSKQTLSGSSGSQALGGIDIKQIQALHFYTVGGYPPPGPQPGRELKVVFDPGMSGGHLEVAMSLGSAVHTCLAPLNEHDLTDLLNNLRSAYLQDTPGVDMAIDSGYTHLDVDIQGSATAAFIFQGNIDSRYSGRMINGPSLEGQLFQLDSSVSCSAP